MLDGGWDQVGRGEDPDAPRRLYYVAMTRAREMLCLARLDAGNRLLDTLSEIPAIQRRTVPALHEPSPLLSRRYERLGLIDVDLGFAGRVEAGAPLHRAIASLSAGAALSVSFERDRGVLLDSAGTVVRRLAASYVPPGGTTCVAARVAAIVTWTRDQSEPEYRSYCRCTTGEVVIPELTFQPI